MRRIILLCTILGSMVILATACAGSSGNTGGGSANGPAKTPYSPNIDPADFTTKIDNKYFPLKPGTTFVYKGTTQDTTEGDVVAVTSDTRNIMGVECVIVKDTVTEDGKMTEQTYDWYAQDKEGNVWYFGEDSKEYENGKVKSTGGSWEAGKDGAQPGIIMPADPKVGHTYRQEYYKGEAQDMARALKLNGSARVPYGSFDHVLVTDEWTPLEPNIAEHKYYAAGVGNVLEIATKGPQERLELVRVKTS
ncbi:MAG TPA: hypothetical protein VFI90_19185 [Rubrobacter sp.]|nr:hypothetical protein [Rubrobacter sp.]